MNGPQRVIRMAELPAFTALHRTQIELLISRGEFPRPIKLSARRRAWLADEVATWQARRIAERDHGAAAR